MMTRFLLPMLGATILGALACVPQRPELEPFLPDVAQASFVDAVDNPFFPLPVGATWVIEAQTPEGLERIEIEVLPDPRDVNGIVATQVKDTAYLDGVLIEDTVDFYAQDSAGNVWYLGEETCVFENEVCVDREGSWEFGLDGALPGFQMPASPTTDGVVYRQEFYVGHAEDTGEVIAVGESVTVPAGTFEDCIRTHDASTLDTALDEEKVYCRGVGNVLILEGEVREELVATSLP